MNFLRLKKRKKTFIIIIILLCLAIATPFIFNAVKYHNNNDFDVIKYDMDVEINEQGDLHIKERMTNKYFRLNKVFYKNLIYGKNNNFSNENDKSFLVEDVSLLVESNNQIIFDSTSSTNYSSHFVGYSYNDDKDEYDNTLACTDDVDDCEIIFYYNRNGINEITTFTYEYTILGAVTSYSDISELNWKFLGIQDSKIENININVKFPESMFEKEEFLVYGHGTMVGDFDLVSNNELVIEVPETLKNEFIEMRILFPNEVFTSIRSENKTTKSGRLEIIESETLAVAYAEKLRLIFKGSEIIFIIFCVYLITLTVYSFFKYDKEYKSDFYNEYYRELPADYEPAIMGYMYRFGEIEDNDLAATILDLIRRKYLILDTNNANVNDKKPDFIIKKNFDIDESALKPFEKHFIKWFIDDIGNKEMVSLEQLQNYTKKESNAIKYNNNNSIWCSMVEKEAANYNFWDKKTSNYKTKMTYFGSIGYLLSIIFFFIYLTFKIDFIFSYAVISLLFTIAFFVYGFAFNRRSVQTNEEFVRWKAFRKFLMDFSTFEDYPLPSLVVWEHYLVYATSFGIADKVMKQLKLKFTASQLTNSDLTFGRFFDNNFFASWYVFNTISRLRVNSMSTINSAKAVRTASSIGGRMGGGGFGGGSSFGGGGGSFGGR